MRRSLALLAQAAAKAGAAPAAGAQPRAPRKQALELTDAAAARIRQLLEERHKVRRRGLRRVNLSLSPPPRSHLQSPITITHRNTSSSA